MRTLLAVVVAGLSFPMTLEAEPTPPGKGWWCYAVQFGRVGSSSECYRDQVSCETRRGETADRDSSVQATEASCTTQRKAALLTWFDVMKDVRSWRLFATLQHCNRARRDLLDRGPDVAKVSRCTVVGDGRPVALNRKVIPPGDGWWCYEARLNGTYAAGECSRTKPECDEKANGVDLACVRFGTAYVFTRGDESIAIESQDGCEAFRASVWVATKPFTSECELSH